MTPALRFAAVAVGVLYAGLILALPPGAFFSGEEGITWIQIDSLRRHWWTSFAIDPPGAAYDPELVFLPAFLVDAGGAVRSLSPVLFALVASIPYTLVGSRGAYLVPAVAALACLVLAFRLARLALGNLDRRWSELAAAASLLATPLVFYGSLLWEHTLAVALCLAGLIPLCKAMETGGGFRSGGTGGRAPAPADPSGRFGAAAGILLALAALTRTEATLLIPAAAAAGVIAWGPRRFGPQAVAALAGAAAVLAPRALYDRLVLGSWSPSRPTLGPFGWGARESADLLLPVIWRPLSVAVVLVLLAAVLLKPRLPRLASTSTIAITAIVAFALLLSMGPILTFALELTGRALPAQQRGFASLTHTMPLVALLPLIALMPGSTTRPAVRFLGWTAGLYVFGALATLPAPGGLQWGPRLLLPAMPPLAIGLVGAVAARRERPAGRLAAACLVAALIAGVAMQGLGLRFQVAVRRHNDLVAGRVQRAVPEGSVILSDSFPVPQLLATLWRARPVLYAGPGADLEVLDARLAESGAASFWLTHPVVKLPWESPPVPPGSRGRTEVQNLGGGLLLWPRGGGGGTHPFTRLPKGD